MKLSSDVQRIIKGEGKSVPINDIEPELARLWKAAIETSGEKSDDEIIRACALNLMVYTSDKREAENVAAILDQLVIQHPCRAIVMIADSESSGPSTSPDLQASISTHHHATATGGHHLYCEQVTMSAKGEVVEELPSIVIPLLIPDLPVFLWWYGDPPFDDELFHRFVSTSDRLILDSTQFQASNVGFAKLSDLIRNGVQGVPDQTICSDLTWSRLTPWRLLTAQFFDPQNLRPYLDRLNRIIFEYQISEDDSQLPAQAFLFAGWLASRLKWQLPPRSAGPWHKIEGHHHFLHLYKDDQPVTIEIRGARGSHVGATGRTPLLLSLKLIADEEPSGLFSITQTDDPLCAEVVIEVEQMTPMKRVVRLEELDLLHLIDKELEILWQDVVYEEALEMAADLMRG
ncbi:MAG: glucose-6-phosphate dehydrogenase assembly protein OpcA [Candidatus Tectomicrobia bacterium]|nr:glucose-6-phosphate dehydrogenase assembly protein OpcA [Candidatus Tectomicrobia bacterium]